MNRQRLQVDRNFLELDTVQDIEDDIGFLQSRHDDWIERTNQPKSGAVYTAAVLD